MRRRSRHNGFNEEGLLAVTLLVAPYDAEAPALVVGFLQDNVTAPVQLTARTRAESELPLSYVKEQNSGVLKEALPRQSQPPSPQWRPVEGLISQVVRRVRFVHVDSLVVLLRVLREGLDDTECHLGLSCLSLHHRNCFVVG